MKFVEPIRDLQKISSMKKILLAQSERNYLLFTLGINSSYRISDLIRVQFKHVLDPKNSVRSHLILTEQKTGKENKVALSKGVKKAIEAYAGQHYEGDPEAYLFRSRKGTNQAISRVQAWTIISDAAKECYFAVYRHHTRRYGCGCSSFGPLTLPQRGSRLVGEQLP